MPPLRAVNRGCSVALHLTKLPAMALFSWNQRLQKSAPAVRHKLEKHHRMRPTPVWPGYTAPRQPQPRRKQRRVVGVQKKRTERTW